MNTSTRIPANRTVAVLTPLVFAPLAGAVSVAAARYVPGVTIDEGSLEAIFIAGATIAFAKAGLWMKGWQAYEQRAGGAHDAPAGADFDDEPFAADLRDTIDEDHAGDLELDEEGPEPDFDFGEDEEDDELMALMSAPEE
jgi:hypothetical protein